jgi:hypothetical protein
MTFPDNEDDLELDPGQDEEEQEEQDPLADLDPEIRERVTAQLEAQKAAEIAEFRTGYSKRFTAAQRDADEKGFVIGDDGKLAVRDPEKFAKFAGQFVGTPPKPEPKTEAEDPIPDPTFDPKGHAAWVARQVQEGVRAAMGPLEGVLAQQQAGSVNDTARAFLESLGMPEAAEHEAFQQHFAQAIATVPLAQRNPQAIQAAAGMALGAALPAIKANPQPKTPAFTTADANRSVVRQIGGSRGNGTRPADNGYSEAELDGARVLGVTPLEYRALGADQTGGAYMKAHQKVKR